MKSCASDELKIEAKTRTRRVQRVALVPGMTTIITENLKQKIVISDP